MGKRIIARRRGAGSSTYRSPSFRHHGAITLPHVEGTGTVNEIEHDPGHNTPIAIVTINEQHYRIPAFDGCMTGMKIICGSHAPVQLGSIKKIGMIPEGTVVSVVEVKPGVDKYFITSPGSSGLVISHGDKTIIQMPSDELKEINNNSIAIIGTVAGAGRHDKPIAKAGKKMKMFRSRAKAPITVRGEAMNPVNHPFGGGSHQHVGRPSTVSHSAWPGRKVGNLGPLKRKKRR